MLNIKNIEKIIGVDRYSTQVKSIHTPNIKHPHPQRTYDIVFQHRDRPGREFFLTLDREGGYNNTIGGIEYPISFWELTGPHNQSTDVKVWESNLLSPHSFLDFVDTIINHYTT